MKVAVFGANGNIGSRVVRGLAQEGHTPIALVRDSAKNAQFPTGCEVRQVTLPNAGELIAATRDAEALLWLTAPNMNVASIQLWYEQCTDALQEALRANPGIRRVVHVSSLGAGAKPRLGTVSYVGDVELRINSAGRNAVHLRPGYFMQNLFMNAQQLAADGVLRLAYAPDHDIPWISVGDIAHVAVRYLVDDSWSGQWSRNLMGPANLTGVELAQGLSKALGRTVRYEQVPAAQLRAMFAGFGLQALVLDELMDLFAALGDPDGVYATARTYEASTPTTFEDFVKAEFAPLLSPALAS